MGAIKSLMIELVVREYAFNPFKIGKGRNIANLRICKFGELQICEIVRP